MALVLDIAGAGDRGRVLAALVHDVEAHGYSTTAGEIGFRFVLQALAQGGRSDLAYRMITQNQKPGYVYQLERGATSLIENWDANPNCSQDHFMLGHAIEWFYRDLAGIDFDPDAPGFRRVVFRPQPVGDLRWVEASYESIRGPISARWERAEGRFILKVEVPANSTGVVFVPTVDGIVKEGGAPANGRPGVTFLRREGDRSVYAIESGSYVFESRF
jgi:hypothetical protein